MSEAQQIHGRHVQQLELELADKNRLIGILNGEIQERERGRDSAQAEADEISRLLEHMKKGARA